MRKLFLSTVLAAAFATASFAQGTVSFSNGTLSRLSVGPVGGGFGLSSMPLTPNAFYFGLFYYLGPTQPSMGQMTFLTGVYGVNSTTGAGIIANPADGKSTMSTVAIPGTASGETDVWIRVAGWSSNYTPDLAGYNAALAASQAYYSDGTYFGQSAIVNVAALGPSLGPGINIWQEATGTAGNKLAAFPLWVTVPEPSALALLGLGAAAMLLRRARKSSARSCLGAKPEPGRRQSANYAN